MNEVRNLIILFAHWAVAMEIQHCLVFRPEIRTASVMKRFDTMAH